MSARPPTYRRTKSTRIAGTWRISLGEREALHAMARERGIAQNPVIREAITEKYTPQPHGTAALRPMSLDPVLRAQLVEQLAELLLAGLDIIADDGDEIPPAEEQSA
jgi:hypothetical protein